MRPHAFSVPACAVTSGYALCFLVAAYLHDITPLAAQQAPVALDSPVASDGGPPRDLASPTDAGEANAELEYMTRGPLHESYAQPYSADPQSLPLVPKEPPEPIKELPPEIKPESDRVRWIPGYWDWDAAREDFVWVSGIWREVPPHRRWVSGYWQQTDEGYRRVSGFWADERSDTVEYLPPPPPSMEEGPTSPSPGDDYFYVPGNWNYRANEYLWTPGFWSRCQPDWVWIPSEYVWTPRGCIFRPGYWDYRFHRRGLVFTPVYYRSPIYRNAGYWYRPRYLVDTGINLLVHLFVNPRYGRYYFGNYYDRAYRGSFYPWVDYYRQPRLYDPLFSYYGIRSLTNRGTSLGELSRQHRFYQEHESLRPPETYAAQVRLRGGRKNVNQESARLATLGRGVDEIARGNPAGFQMRRISEQQSDSWRRQAEQSFDRVQRTRRNFEHGPPVERATRSRGVAGRPGTGIGNGQTARFRLPSQIGSSRSIQSPRQSIDGRSFERRSGPVVERGFSEQARERSRRSSSPKLNRSFSPERSFSPKIDRGGRGNGQGGPALRGRSSDRGRGEGRGMGKGDGGKSRGRGRGR